LIPSGFKILCHQEADIWKQCSDRLKILKPAELKKIEKQPFTNMLLFISN